MAREHRRPSAGRTRSKYHLNACDPGPCWKEPGSAFAQLAGGEGGIRTLVAGDTR